MTEIFCKRPGSSPQNYLYSGLPEINSILNNFSLLFNPEKGITYNLNQDSVTALQTLDGGEKFKSRKKFNQMQQQKLNTNDQALVNIDALQEFPYKVVSASYGCNHDFLDPKTASYCYNVLLQHNYPNFMSLDGIVKNTLLQFSKGINIINTSTLDNIWIKTQDIIDRLLEEQQYSFPTINEIIYRKKPDTDNEDLKNQSKMESKNLDLQNIEAFLSNNKIDARRIVWVIDTYQSWLDRVSQNKLDLSNSIAVIDGATSSISGSVQKPCADLETIQIGPLIFKNNRPGNYIEIFNTNGELLANCAYGASVTTIINLISELGRDLTGASRSNIGTPYKIEWVKDMSNEEKIFIVELVKAAGDQVPVDICKNCLEQEDLQGSSDDSIMIFTTGDLLAYQMAKSLGVGAFFISASKIMFSIPSCLINQDLATPTLINFITKFKQMKTFYENIEIFNNAIIPELNKLENISASGQITCMQFYQQYLEYIERVNVDSQKMLNAYKLLSEVMNDPSNPNSLNNFYIYLKNNLNNINFTPDSLYDFLFSSRSDQYEGFTYNEQTKSFDKIILDPMLPPENDDDNFNVVTFCDNLKYINEVQSGATSPDYNATAKLDPQQADCRGDSSTFIKDSPVKYIQNACFSSSDPNCVNNYQRTGLKPIPNPIPKNYVYKNFTADAGKLDEGWFLVGDIVVIDFKRDTNGNILSDPETNLPIKEDKNLPGNVPLAVLENSIQSTLVDLLWQIPYQAFAPPLKPSGEMNTEAFIKKIKYMIKSLQIALQDLYVEEEYLNSLIIFALFGYAVCPPTAIDENGNAINQSDSQVTSSRRSGRGRSGIVGSTLSTQQGSQMITTYVTMFVQYFNVEQVVSAIVSANDETSFSTLRLDDPQFLIQNPTNAENAKAVLDKMYIETFTSIENNIANIKQKQFEEYNKIISSEIIALQDSSVLQNIYSTLLQTGGRKTLKKKKKRKKTKRNKKQKKTYKKKKSQKKTKYRK